MEYTKIVQADGRGQIVIPKKIRQKLGLKDGSAFWIYVDNGKIMLEKIKEPKK